MVTLGSPTWWSNFLTFGLFSIVLGWAGVDRFYKGEILWGILKFISGGGFLIWYIVDIFVHAYRLGTTGQWTKGAV